MRVVIVAGPPGSGKTTYVKRHMRTGDLVIDLDAILVAISGMPNHEHTNNLLPYALACRDVMYDLIPTDRDTYTAWVVACLPVRAERNALRDMLHADVVVLARPESKCVEQLRSDTYRAGKADSMVELIRSWWKRYQPAQGDVVIEGEYASQA